MKTKINTINGIKIPANQFKYIEEIISSIAWNEFFKKSNQNFEMAEFAEEKGYYDIAISRINSNNK